MGFTPPFERRLRDGLTAEVEKEGLDRTPLDLYPRDAGQVTNVWKALLAGKTRWLHVCALFAWKQRIRRHIGE